MSGRAPSSWLVPGSIPWTPKNARERSQERQFSFSALALLTTPQKHLRIASYKLWSHSGSNQARTSRKPAKITFFHVFSLAQAFFFDQKFKYRGPPPIYVNRMWSYVGGRPLSLNFWSKKRRLVQVKTREKTWFSQFFDLFSLDLTRNDFIVCRKLL